MKEGRSLEMRASRKSFGAVEDLGERKESWLEGRETGDCSAGVSWVVQGSHKGNEGWKEEGTSLDTRNWWEVQVPGNC